MFFKDWDLLEKSFEKSESYPKKNKEKRIQEFESILGKKERLFDLSN